MARNRQGAKESTMGHVAGHFYFGIQFGSRTSPEYFRDTPNYKETPDGLDLTIQLPATE